MELSSASSLLETYLASFIICYSNHLCHLCCSPTFLFALIISSVQTCCLYCHYRSFLVNGIDNKRLMVENLKWILDQFRNELNAQLQILEMPTRGVWCLLSAWRTDKNAQCMHSGGFSWVPKDWQFPWCGVFDLWRLWWVDDQVQQVPPLWFLSSKGMRHLNGIPLGDEEMHGRTGGKPENRRPV